MYKIKTMNHISPYGLQKLEERGIFNRTEEMNKALAQLSKQAADGKAWVAGDIAPTGRFLAPLGDASFEELVDIYTEQAAGLEQAGVDLYVIETMMTLTDARAAVLAIRSMSKKPILVSFTCDESGKILSGTDVVAALSVMEGMGVSAFGLNCSAGPEQMLPQLQRLHKYARVRQEHDLQGPAGPAGRQLPGHRQFPL